jgi:excisionase family DNA binding protein
MILIAIITTFLVFCQLESEGGLRKMCNIAELTPREVAIRLNVSLGYVYHLVWAKKLPAERTRGRWLIPVDAVEVRLKAKEAANGTAGG